MKNEKFSFITADLGGLIADYHTCKNDLAKANLEELIVAFADNFVKMYRRESATTEKKIESACNCKSDETPNNSDFQDIFETVKRTLAEWSNDEKFIGDMAQLIIDRKKKG